MTLFPGARLGPYEIVAPLGAGGMGEVHRAKDPRLGRDVAIKALPEAFARDAERLARFEREARLLASLSHPNVAGIHGLELVDGLRYLVLEFVEGETLAARLARGALPPAEAADVCRQIAAGVEAAHEAGVVHRDLKPGNVMLKPDGAVKVLDFGLAKGASAAGGSSSNPDLSASPTMTYAATQQGMILGTAAYMSPEQARGKPVDRRTDIWSFGCVLYECLTGRPVFEGETVSDLVARILERDPDWSRLPPNVSVPVRQLLGRCLTKDVRERLRDIGEARIALGETTTVPVSSAVPAEAVPRAGSSWVRRALLVTAVAMGGIALGAFLPRARTESTDGPIRLAVLPPGPDPEFGDLGSFAISPDGRLLAFTMADSQGTRRLCVRPLAKDEPRVLQETEGAQWPFWSPDAKDIAFFSNGRLRRVPATGGSARVVCEASNGRGGSWGRAGTIVFAPDPIGGLAAVAANGGVARAVTVVDTTVGDNSHRFPAFLPDGRHFIFTVNSYSGVQLAKAMVGSLDDPRAKPLLESNSAPEFAAPDQVIYSRDRALLSQRIDLRTLAMVGEPRLLADQPEVVGQIQLSRAVSCSRTGIMVYAPPDRRPLALARIESDGRITRTRVRLPATAYLGALSPDRRRLALVVTEPDGYASWIADLEEETAVQIAPVGRGVHYPIWNPAGTRIVGAGIGGMRQVDPGSGADSAFELGDPLWRIPDSFTGDGRTLILSALVGGNRYDLQVLTLSPGEKPRPYLATAAHEGIGMLSHDGRWIAYISDGSGSSELHVERFPDHAEGVRAGVPVPALGASVSGHAWRPDDRELYFIGGDGLTVYAVEVRTAPRLALGVPRPVRRVPDDARSTTVLEDGRVLVLQPQGLRARSLTVVQNWMHPAHPNE